LGGVQESERDELRALAEVGSPFLAC
jgi:hypothetical protein